METELLLTQQLLSDAAQIEQCLEVVYDTDYSYRERRLALQYCFVQARHMQELVSALLQECQFMEGVITSDQTND